MRYSHSAWSPPPEASRCLVPHPCKLPPDRLRIKKQLGSHRRRENRLPSEAMSRSWREDDGAEKRTGSTCEVHANATPYQPRAMPCGGAVVPPALRVASSGLLRCAPKSLSNICSMSLRALEPEAGLPRGLFLTSLAADRTAKSTGPSSTQATVRERARQPNSRLHLDYDDHFSRGSRSWKAPKSERDAGEGREQLLVGDNTELEAQHVWTWWLAGQDLDRHISAGRPGEY